MATDKTITMEASWATFLDKTTIKPVDRPNAAEAPLPEASVYIQGGAMAVATLTAMISGLY